MVSQPSMRFLQKGAPKRNGPFPGSKTPDVTEGLFPGSKTLDMADTPQPERPVL